MGVGGQVSWEGGVKKVEEVYGVGGCVGVVGGLVVEEGGRVMMVEDGGWRMVVEGREGARLEEEDGGKGGRVEEG